MTDQGPDVAGIAELAERWNVSDAYVHDVVGRPSFPAFRDLKRGRVWSIPAVAAWEDGERAAGRPLPGERPRGPRPGTGGRPRAAVAN